MSYIILSLIVHYVFEGRLAYVLSHPASAILLPLCIVLSTPIGNQHFAAYAILTPLCLPGVYTLHPGLFTAYCSGSPVSLITVLSSGTKHPRMDPPVQIDRSAHIATVYSAL